MRMHLFCALDFFASGILGTKANSGLPREAEEVPFSLIIAIKHGNTHVENGGRRSSAAARQTLARLLGLPRADDNGS